MTKNACDIVLINPGNRKVVFQSLGIEVATNQILSFRDNPFHEYFSNPAYLGMLEEKFGIQVRKHIQDITSMRLKRKICQ